MSGDRAGVADGGNGLSVFYRSEADLRDALAEYADMCGWRVERERHIPGWGRADLFLSTSTGQYAVELKLKLTRTADIRKAFQQADAYSKALPGVDVILAAPVIDHDLAATYNLAYTDVFFMAVGSLMNWLQSCERDKEERHVVARSRHIAAQRSVTHRFALLAEMGAHDNSTAESSRVDAEVTA